MISACTIISTVEIKCLFADTASGREDSFAFASFLALPLRRVLAGYLGPLVVARCWATCGDQNQLSSLEFSGDR
jgi:hypothetical protein